MASASGSRLQPLSGEQQESLIKSRMQVDERSLRRLIKKLTLLLSSTDSESIAASRLSFKADLESYRLQLLRLSSIAHNTSSSEIRSYTDELSSITAEQTSTQGRINALKRKLEDVRRERKNKLEYDLVAGEIVKLPTREELEESLGRLQEGLEEVRREREKYRALSKDAGERMSGVVREVGRLREDVGFEVGERERREVERADGEGEGEATDIAAGEEGSEAGVAGKGSRRVSEDEVEEGEEQEEGAAPGTRSGSSTPRRAVTVEAEAQGGKLDPAAPTFRPSAAGGEMRRKRDSTAVTGSDEEGEVGDGSSSTAAASNSNTPRKRQRTEEGEVAGGAESEEEEGSIQPSAPAMARQSSARSASAGTKRRR